MCCKTHFRVKLYYTASYSFLGGGVIQASRTKVLDTERVDTLQACTSLPLGAAVPSSLLSSFQALSSSLDGWPNTKSLKVEGSKLSRLSALSVSSSSAECTVWLCGDNCAWQIVQLLSLHTSNLCTSPVSYITLTKTTFTSWLNVKLLWQQNRHLPSTWLRHASSITGYITKRFNILLVVVRTEWQSNPKISDSVPWGCSDLKKQNKNKQKTNSQYFQQVLTDAWWWGGGREAFLFASNTTLKISTMTCSKVPNSTNY